MDYNRILSLVREKTGEDTELKVLPKGSRMLHGIIIGNGETRPTLYIEDFKQDSDDEIADAIADVYNREFENSVNFHFSMVSFMDWETANKNIFPVLQKKDTLIDSRVVTLPFMEDMVFYFRYEADSTPTQSYTIVLLHEHLEMWDISADELKEAALSNLFMRNDFDIVDIASILGDTIEKMDLFPSEFILELPLYAVSNSRRMYGANLLTSEKVLKTVMERVDGNFFIIPSSIHEFLVLPTSYGASPDDIRQMVRDVNDAEVAEDEQLSNNVYLFTQDGISVA